MYFSQIIQDAENIWQLYRNGNHCSVLRQNATGIDRCVWRAKSKSGNGTVLVISVGYGTRVLSGREAKEFSAPFQNKLNAAMREKRREKRRKEKERRKALNPLN